jgi:hypothetical protein
MSDAGRDLPISPPSVSHLIEEARADFDELLVNGRLSRAAQLMERTGVEFDPTYCPMYFTGAFEARVVLIHLNPKLSARLGGARYTDFEAYLDAHRRFGYHHWGSDPNYRSAFDQKQVRFLRPFSVIDFVPETDRASKRNNAALAIDAKLQLELVPYGSPTFPTQLFAADLLRPHFDRVLGVVLAYPRNYVLFCGAVFDDLLDRAGVVVSRDEHRFRLATRAGTSRNEYRFSNVVIDHRGHRIHAGVARSFAVQGLPMSDYGRKCHELYQTGEGTP